jgi:uncharacterized protein YbaA (DUF1428 family)
MRYVDGYILVVPEENLDEYRKIAAKAGKIWVKHGALDYLECIGDDMEPDMGGMKIKTFPQLTKQKPGELILYSFIIYKSKAHRDSVNKKVMKDPYMSPDNQKDMEMPFDIKKMTYGGFKAIVDEKAKVLR